MCSNRSNKGHQTRTTLRPGAIFCAGLLTTHCVQAGTGVDLLDLPFEDLLEVEIQSAGKRDKQIRDIPASVTIVIREEIARYGWAARHRSLSVPGQRHHLGARAPWGSELHLPLRRLARAPCPF